jgi:predicted  nucleic acid-binding Zn ribbon protein
MKPEKIVCPVCNKRYEIYTVYPIIDFKCTKCRRNKNGY